MNTKIKQKTDAKYLERYANVYTLTRSIPRDRRFQMDQWGVQDSQSECGTAACMAGHAALHPWFRRRRFMLRTGRHVWSLRTVLVSPDGGNPTDLVIEFFGVNDDLEVHPFHPDYYAGKPTPKQAAAALKKYMRLCWPKAEVEAAIASATTTYDPAYVHKYAKWEAV